MAIKLSQGLLSSLGAAGGTPQDARQPMGSGLLQPALSSNPLVNTLVRKCWTSSWDGHEDSK